MKRTLGQLALAGVFAILAGSASAVTIDPFDPLLNAGDNTLGNAVADPLEFYEGGSGTELFFDVAEALRANISITINPYLLSPNGTPSNDIDLFYSISGGAPMEIAVTQTLVPAFAAIGSAGLNLVLAAGQEVRFFVEGQAGGSGNQVTFIVETSVVPIGATGLLLLSGFGALAATRRRKAKTTL